MNKEIIKLSKISKKFVGTNKNISVTSRAIKSVFSGPDQMLLNTLTISVKNFDTVRKDTHG